MTESSSTANRVSGSSADHGSAVLAAQFVDSVPRAELQRITRLQAEMCVAPLPHDPADGTLPCSRLSAHARCAARRSHQSLRMSNEQLGEFNQHAAAQHAALSARFGKHVTTLNAVQADLMVVFRRISAIKKKLLQDHPELHELHEQLSAERERTLESEPPTPTPSS